MIARNEADTQALYDRLGSRDGSIRREAMIHLCELGIDGLAEVPHIESQDLRELRQRVSSDDHLISTGATVQLAEIGTDQAVDLLASIVNGSYEPRDKLAAVWALGETANPRASEYIEHWFYEGGWTKAKRASLGHANYGFKAYPNAPPDLRKLLAHYWSSSIAGKKQTQPDALATDVVKRAMDKLKWPEVHRFHVDGWFNDLGEQLGDGYIYDKNKGVIKAALGKSSGNFAGMVFREGRTLHVYGIDGSEVSFGPLQTEIKIKVPGNNHYISYTFSGSYPIVGLYPHQGGEPCADVKPDILRSFARAYQRKKGNGWENKQAALALLNRLPIKLRRQGHMIYQA